MRPLEHFPAGRTSSELKVDFAVVLLLLALTCLQLTLAETLQLVEGKPLGEYVHDVRSAHWYLDFASFLRLFDVACRQSARFEIPETEI